MRELTAYEQATIDVDQPVIEHWLAEHSDLGGELVVDRDGYDSNVGHVLLVVRLRDHSAVRRTRDELIDLLARPEHLRVQRWMPDPTEVLRLQDEVHRLQETVWALRGDGPGCAHVTVTWPDPETGFLVVALDRRDPAFAAQIEAVRPGWVRVHPDPICVAPLT